MCILATPAYLSDHLAEFILYLVYILAMPSKAQQRAAKKQQYADNKDAIKEERKVRYYKNCEAEKLYTREYHKNNVQH